MIKELMSGSLNRLSILCFESRSLCSLAKKKLFLPSTTNNTVRRKLCFGTIRSSFSVSSGLKIRGVSPFNIRSMSGSITTSSMVDQVAPENGPQQVQLLIASEDDHGGVIVDMKEPMDSKVFISSLKASMSCWRQQGKRGVWIKLPIELVNLVEAIVKEGFWYHHAEPKYLMLVYWIPETVCSLPVNATHRVGIGAFVVNDKREVLVVQENSGMFRGTGIWKLPTGVVEEGEDICVGAMREVKEETGIDTEFMEVLAFRQSHKAFFEKSDLFFVCMLRPLSFSIEKQESEIKAAQWMPIEEYAAQPSVQNIGLLKNIFDIGFAKMDQRYAGFSTILTRSFHNPCLLYLNNRDMNKPPSSGNQD